MNATLQTKFSHLEKETKILFNSIEGLTEEQLHDQSYGWSIIQVLSHLQVAETGTIKYMTKKMQAGDKMPDYGFGNKLRLTLTKRMLNSSLKWKAPKPVAHPESESSLEEMKALWNTAREQTKTYLAAYPDQFLGKAVFKHPMAGRLDLAGAIDSMTYHQRHHLHQIKRIKKAIA